MLSKPLLIPPNARLELKQAPAALCSQAAANTGPQNKDPFRLHLRRPSGFFFNNFNSGVLDNSILGLVFLRTAHPLIFTLIHSLISLCSSLPGPTVPLGSLVFYHTRILLVFKCGLGSSSWVLDTLFLTDLHIEICVVGWLVVFEVESHCVDQPWTHRDLCWDQSHAHHSCQLPAFL